MLLPNQIHTTRRYLYYVFIVLLACIGIGSSVFVYYKVGESSSQHIIDRANTIAATLSPDQISDLKGDAEDINSSTYGIIKSRLTKIRSVNSDIRFVYIIGERNNELFFFADSEDPESQDYSPPGQVYEEGTEVMRGLFLDGKSRIEGPEPDRWGIWISAYAPILDSTGRVIALLGIDVPADEFITNIVTYASLPLVAVLVLILVISVIQHMRSRELMYIEQKAEFLSIASHEIRTPLTGIRWAMENLISRPENGFDDSTKKLFSLMYDNCIGLINRMNNLLSITSIEGGAKIGLQKEPVRMRPLIEDVVSSLSLAARQRNISIAISNTIKDDLLVDCDIQDIRHVFANLISNAIKYTNEGTEVLIDYRYENNSHIFSIIDHGNGISKEEQSFIFDGYRRSNTARQSSQYGNGLGLYLTKKIVEMHGGDISINSELSKGSTFVISLPIRSENTKK